MLSIEHPWLALLVVLPMLIRLLPAHREARASVRAPFFDEVVRQLGRRPEAGAVELRKNRAQLLLAPLVWVLVIAALMRPQWVGEPIVEIESARDLMLVVDLSGSMDTADFTASDGARLTRLGAVKAVLADFATQRQTDRLGLIVFGDAAFVQVPFTLDHEVFLQLLEETTVGMAGPRTMLGDALGLAVKAFDASEADTRTVVLLTDGNDTGSKVPPAKAARLAAERGLTVYVIGVGDPAATGEAPLDEAVLGEIADLTGGVYFRAEDRDGLAGVSRRIDKLEPLEYESTSFRPKWELYPWPLAAALALILVYHLAMAARTLLTRTPDRPTVGKAV